MISGEKEIPGVDVDADAGAESSEGSTGLDVALWSKPARVGAGDDAGASDAGDSGGDNAVPGDLVPSCEDGILVDSGAVFRPVGVGAGNAGADEVDTEFRGARVKSPAGVLVRVESNGANERGAAIEGASDNGSGVGVGGAGAPVCGSIGDIDSSPEGPVVVNVGESAPAAPSSPLIGEGVTVTSVSSIKAAKSEDPAFSLAHEPPESPAKSTTPLGPAATAIAWSLAASSEPS